MTYVAFVGATGPVTGYTVYEGENTGAAGDISGVVGDPPAARAAFMARLTGVSVEDFESYNPGSVDRQFQERPVTRNGTTMQINSDYGSAGTYFVVVTWSGSGRFNTTSGGEQLLDNCVASAAYPITITFTTPIAAFGWYLTDLGDFSGQISMELTKSGGGTVSFDIDHTLGAANGSLYFWGFVDQIDTYTQVKVLCSSSEDIFGIDDWVWATASYLI